MPYRLLFLSFFVCLTVLSLATNAQQQRDQEQQQQQRDLQEQFPSQEACRDETAPLLNDTSLAIAQSVIFQDYNASFYDRCQFGFSGVGCDITFEGDDRTYNALCAAAGGQVYSRPVVLRCALGTIQHDLGAIPTCVGDACNITEIQPQDVTTPQVQDFLDSLKLTGCTASGNGSGAKPIQPIRTRGWGLVVLCLTTLSALFGL